jgi:hypothetical protein
MNEKELQEIEDVFEYSVKGQAHWHLDDKKVLKLIAEVRRLNELYRECADDATQFKQALELILEHSPYSRQGEIAYKVLKGETDE